MGKHKKEHKEHKHKHRERSEDAPPVLVPKLIVKLGGSPAADRADSPGAPVLEQQGGLEEHHHHHHRHKDKKKKKKKDKKKSHEKDREHREHRHHHKSKKRKREHGEAAEVAHSSFSPSPSLPLAFPASPQPSPSPEPAAKRARLSSTEQAGALLASPRRELPSRSCVPKPPSPLAKILEYLLLMLEKKDFNNFFASPVSDTFAPGYSNIIKDPMDFSTMREKIEDLKYKTFDQFRHDFNLICNNCMTYNLPETVYFKTAKQLQRQGLRILAPERLAALAEHLPLIRQLSKGELGFDISAEEPATEQSSEHREDVSRYIEEIRQNVKRPPGKFEAIPDPIGPEELASQVRAAARGAADKLVRRGVSGQMGYLKNRPDGSASLAIITPDPDSASSSGSGRVEKPVTLSQLVGKVKNGTSALAGFKEDRRNVAKAVHPLYYGAFSSHGPTHDSTFANLTKAETELVYSTYGDDVGVSYAESIKNFSRNCEYATVIVDHLLDILTDQQHRKTSKYLEEQQLLREEESVVDDAFTDSRIDFDSLKSLEKEGIDMSFLGDLERRYHGEPAAALGATAGLLEELRGAQHERLAGAASSNLAALPEVGPREAELAERVQGGLAEMVSAVRPRDLLPSSMAGVRRAMGLPEAL